MDVVGSTVNCTNTETSSLVERKHSAIKQLSEFAALCSFIQHFGTELGICLTFEQLVQFLSLEEGVNWKKWESLHIKLLNLIRLRARPDRWEPVLARFVQLNIRPSDSLSEVSVLLQSDPDHHTDSSADSRPHHVPRLPYYNLDFRARTRLLLALLEAQFERNQSFKDKINLRAAEDLRIHPLGWDVWGRSYWLLKDSAVNILLYRDSGLEHETIQLLCETTDEIRQLYDSLKDICMDGSKLSTILASIHPPQTSQSCNGSAEVSQALIEETTLIDTSLSKPADDLDIKSNPSPRSPLNTTDDAPRAFIKPEDQATETSNIDAKPESVAESPPKSPDRVAVCEGGSDDVAAAPSDEKPVGQVEQTANSPCTPSSVRRSGRQRKPVEFLTIEPLHSNRSRSKPTPKAVKEEEKPKKRRKKASTPIETTSKAKKIPKKPEKVVKKKEKKKEEKRKKKRKRYCLPKTLGTRWDKLSSSSETDDEEDETFERALLAHAYGGRRSGSSSSSISDHKPSATDWLDHPESDLDLDGAIESTGSEANSITQGRNLARQIRLQKGIHRDQQESTEVYDISECCQICDQSHSPEWLLLCDRCDLGHHAMCLSPPRYIIPEGDWYCPRCQHAALLTSLVECADSLDAERKKHDVWRRMQERLNYVNISMTNILADGDDVENGEHEKGTAIEIAPSQGLRKRQRATVRYAESHSETEVSSIFDDDQSSYTDSHSDQSASRRKRFRRAPVRYVNGFRKSRRPVLDSENEAADQREEKEDESGSDVFSASGHCAPRATRLKPAVYNMDEAFKQLDEALETDEKYQEKKRSRHCRQAVPSETVPPGRSRGKDLSNILGPDWKEFDGDKPKSRRRRRIGQLSSSSDNGSADDTIKVGHGGSDNDDDVDFQPSSTSSIEQSGESEVELDPSVASESVSSDNSWLCAVRRASRNKPRNNLNSRRRRNANSGGRRRRPIPRFEQSSEEEREEERQMPKKGRPQRQTRTVVCYRESDDEEEEADADPTSDSKAWSKFSKVRRLRASDDDDSGHSNQCTSDQAASPSMLKSRPRRRLLSSDSDESNRAAIGSCSSSRGVSKVKVEKSEAEEKEMEVSGRTRSSSVDHDSSTSVSNEDEKSCGLKIVESPAELSSAAPSPQVPLSAPVSPP